MFSLLGLVNQEYLDVTFLENLLSYNEIILNQNIHSPSAGAVNTLTASLQRGKTSPNDCP